MSDDTHYANRSAALIAEGRAAEWHSVTCACGECLLTDYLVQHAPEWVRIDGRPARAE